MTNHQLLSQAVEIFGVVMQLGILVMLLVRRLGLKFPALGLTLVFFLLRSATSYVTQHFAAALHGIDAATWTKIVLGFNITEDVLQAAIIVELSLWLVPILGAWRKRIWWRLAVGAAIAAGFAAVSTWKLGYWPDAITRAHGIPTLTLVLFNGHVALVALTAELVLLAALATVALAQADAPVTGARQIQRLGTMFALGWGIFGSVNLTGLAVGHYAMQRSDMSLWITMQMIVIGAYVLMMVLWAVSLVYYKPAKVETKTA